MPTLGECPEVVAVELGGPRCRSDPIRDGVAGFAARTLGPGHNTLLFGVPARLLLRPSDFES